MLLTGGVLRPDGYELGEGKYYGSARLLELDLATGQTQKLLQVDKGTLNFPEVHPNLEFTVGCADGPDLVWLAMDTEIRCYDRATWHLQATFSHPCFHNVHSVTVRGDRLYVTSTGLDMVAVLDKTSGALLELKQTDGREVWYRFSPDADYRQLHSTRPHDCHPNHVFWIGDELWVTRCTQEDAVAVDNPSRRIDVSRHKKPISIHDGVAHDGRIWFTLVDGTVVSANAANPLGEPAQHIDLSSMPEFGGLRGWCRGLCFNGDGLAYIGFSRLRKTRTQSKLSWIRRGFGLAEPFETCSVLAVDLEARRIVRDYRLPLGELDALYGILPHG